MRSSRRAARHDVRRAEAEGSVPVPFKYRKYEDGGFKTPTGKIELYSTRFEQMGYAPLPFYEEPPESPIAARIAEDYPLVLTTGARIPYYFNSEHRQIENLRKAYRDPMADIHPDTAARFGIKKGDWMWIETRRGASGSARGSPRGSTRA